MRLAVMFFTILLMFSGYCCVQAEIVLSGTPQLRISEGGTSRAIDTLSVDDAAEYKCVVSEVDGKYYWSTRENVELVRVAGGLYVTYIAVNGGGYVRIIDPGFKELMAPMMTDEEKRFDYVEHMLTGLSSISYYGTLE